MQNTNVCLDKFKNLHRIKKSVIYGESADVRDMKNEIVIGGNKEF